MFVALVIQHEMRMHHMFCPAVENFSTLSHKRHDFRKKKKKKFIEYFMPVLIFSTIFVWNISHSKKKWARYDQECISVFIWSTRYSCQTLMKFEFSKEVFENPQMLDFVQTLPLGVAQFFRAKGRKDGQTDRCDEANSRFSQVCKRA